MWEEKSGSKPGRIKCYKDIERYIFQPLLGNSLQNSLIELNTKVHIKQYPHPPNFIHSQHHHPSKTSSMCRKT